MTDMGKVTKGRKRSRVRRGNALWGKSFPQLPQSFQQNGRSCGSGGNRIKSLHKSMSREKRTAILTKNLQSQVCGEKDSAFWMRSVLRRRLSECAAVPSGGSFLPVQKGTKDTFRRGDFDFPPPKNHPLETTKHKGGCGPPYWK